MLHNLHYDFYMPRALSTIAKFQQLLNRHTHMHSLRLQSSHSHSDSHKRCNTLRENNKHLPQDATSMKEIKNKTVKLCKQSKQKSLVFSINLYPPFGILYNLFFLLFI